MLVVNERFCSTCLATFEIDRGFMFKGKTSNTPYSQMADTREKTGA